MILLGFTAVIGVLSLGAILAFGTMSNVNCKQTVDDLKLELEKMKSEAGDDIKVEWARMENKTNGIMLAIDDLKAALKNVTELRKDQARGMDLA